MNDNALLTDLSGLRCSAPTNTFVTCNASLSSCTAAALSNHANNCSGNALDTCSDGVGEECYPASPNTDTGVCP